MHQNEKKNSVIGFFVMDFGTLSTRVEEQIVSTDRISRYEFLGIINLMRNNVRVGKLQIV